MSGNEEKFIQRLDRDVQSQGDFYDTEDPKEIYDLVQEDYSNAVDNDTIVESYDTFEGTSYLFKNDDGQLNSYFKNNEGQVIRSQPDSKVIDVYTGSVKSKPKSISKSLMGKVFGDTDGFY